MSDGLQCKSLRLRQFIIHELKTVLFRVSKRSVTCHALFSVLRGGYRHNIYGAVFEVSQPSNCVSCQSTPETQVSMATVFKSMVAPDILNTRDVLSSQLASHFFHPGCI